MLLIVGTKKKDRMCGLFLTFDLSKAELSMYLFTLILQKEFLLNESSSSLTTLQPNFSKIEKVCWAVCGNN